MKRGRLDASSARLVSSLVVMLAARAGATSVLELVSLGVVGLAARRRSSR